MSGRSGSGDAGRRRGTPSRGLSDRFAGRLAAPGLRRLPRRVTVRGPSMAPTLREGDVVVALPGARVRAGSVALVRWAARPGQLSVKRLHEPTGDGRWVVHGDDPAASTDSRELGPAEALAPVVCRLWPQPGRVRRHHPRRDGGR